MANPEAEIKIFISYRRSGESGFVGRLTDRLSSSYGINNVFRDVSGLRSGEEFEKRIGSKLSEATVVIAAIGADWSGRRLFRKSRIRSNDDWVRKELEHALASETPVIPILVGDAVLPTPNQLPASLKGLLAVHTGRIRDESWENDFSELRRSIDAVVQGRANCDEGAPFVWSRVEADEPNHLRLIVPVVALALLIVGLSMLNLKEKQNSTENQDQYSVRLDDPSTWTSPPPSEARNRIAHLALKLALLELQASTKEAKNENDGFNVSKFTQRFEMKNIPWSSAFVTWCYLEAVKRIKNDGEAKLPFTDSPSSQAVAASLRKNGWLREPFDATDARPGDIIFFRITNSIGHMEVVYAITASTVCSIGGNVNNQVNGRCRPIDSENLAALGAIPREVFE